VCGRDSRGEARRRGGPKGVRTKQNRAVVWEGWPRAARIQTGRQRWVRRSGLGEGSAGVDVDEVLVRESGRVLKWAASEVTNRGVEPGCWARLRTPGAYRMDAEPSTIHRRKP
jgi:hypothetical protein